MKERILEILKESPTLSNREIGKIVGLSRSAVQYYMKKLNIHRDRKAQQKLNNTSREKVLRISPNAEQIILGSILGDGYMSPNRHPANTKLTLNSELRITHGVKQEGYIKYKMNLLEKEGIKCHLDFINGGKIAPHFIKGILVKENGTFHMKTQRNVAFNFYRNLFYRPNKKLCRYLYKIKPLALAIWFMDDGFKNGRSWNLATNGFSWKEVQFLQQVLKHNFNLDTNIHKSNLGHPIIYIRTSCREKFLELVSPYVCKTMRYKLEL